MVGSLLVAALAVCVLPGVADAKKKPDRVKVLSYNLYLGSDLDPAQAAAQASRTDKFADEVGFVLKDVLGNNFPVRAEQIAKDIKKRKVDLIGLQEAAFWRLQSPTDGGAPPVAPNAQRATNPVVDYLGTLLEELNEKAMTKKQCKKKDIPKSKCYRGYDVEVVANEADIEFAGDFDNNPGPDGVTCDISAGPEACPPPAPPAGNPNEASWTWGNDDTGVSFGEPPSPPFPPDANFDNPPFNGAADAPGATDCQDTNPSTAPVPPFQPVWGTNPASVCLFHGIDGDLSLTMRDAILKRKGAGVKTEGEQGANFARFVSLPLFGGAATVRFLRGYTAVDANVRGKRFRLVNTHLESNSAGTVREDQAAELVGPGGVATLNPTVLLGDLNSDPAREPVNLPDGDGGSSIAINRLFAAGFRSLSGPGLTSGHGELLSDTSKGFDGRVDHVLTNSADIEVTSTEVIDTFANGLFNSDHGGVFSRLRIKGGKKK